MKCPFCGSSMEHNDPPPLSKRQRIVYKKIAAAGPGGIERDKLIKTLWPDGPSKGSDIMLRVLIHGINRVITDRQQKIVAKGERRWLVTEI